MIGKLLSHYRIVEKIGAGGMGEVYRARDERLERDVALKVLPAGTLADEAARKRFRKEALALSKLNHPHIATVFDFDTQHGLDFLVMEYVPGPSLAETLADGALSEKEVVRLGGQIASALEEAHSQRVVHRDLKPGNIALTAKGDVKVLDFGLAKLVQPASQTTTVDTLSETQSGAGTLPYMAPEQLRGEAVDARTDLWALGVVLYQMVTGRRPFQQELGTALAADILQQAPPPPGRLKPHLSTRLEEIILKCLEKEPEHRYQSAKELLVDLRRPATLTGVSPRRPSDALGVKVPEGSARLRLMVRLGAVGIAVVALLAVLIGLNVGGLRDRLTGGAASGPITSIAVLPLANLMGDAEQDYFVDGMTEAVITELSKIGALKVISRTSVMRYKNTDKSLPEIASELGVDAVVEGSVLRSGDRVRITAQLIHAATDEHLWADNFDRSLGDILALHSEVARAIVSEVAATLTPAEESRLATTRRVMPAAHDAFLKGRYHVAKFTPEEVQTGVDYFEKAIALDPDYALPYAWLAHAYVLLGQPLNAMSSHEAMPRARKAALKALELDETLAEAHLNLGYVLEWHVWDWAGAEREFRRALELNPGLALARAGYGSHLMVTGRFKEAVEEMRRAVELDPLYPHLRTLLAEALWSAGRFDEAIEECRRALELDPKFVRAYRVMSVVYWTKGKPTEAIRIDLTHLRRPEEAAELRRAYETEGLDGYLRAEIKRLKNEEGEFRWAVQLATSYALLGETDQAMRWLEQAHQERRSQVASLKMNRLFDPLRDDPRFQDLLRRMNFPE